MKKKYNYIDLFAGCGGLNDGFEANGNFNLLAAIEWEKSPLATLKLRLKEKYGIHDADRKCIRFDIQRNEELFVGWENDAEYGASDGLDKIVAGEKVDIIVGGPPCQAYSIAGRIQDQHGMQNDYRNYLFENYIKIVEHFQPMLFVFENVPGILSAKPNDINIIETIREQFSKIDYTIIDDVKKAVVDLSEYGVPQNRKRVIIIGIKTELLKNNSEILDKFYSKILVKYKKKKISVREAIGDLPKLLPCDECRINGKKTSHQSNQQIDITEHVPRFHSIRDKGVFYRLLRDIETGENKYSSIESLKQLYFEITGKRSNIHKYNVIGWNEQSNTIVAHLHKDGFRHIHPDIEQLRTLTVREAARLQTFADDYHFLGSMGDKFKMIGNAVPPAFSNILSEAVIELLKEIE